MRRLMLSVVIACVCASFARSEEVAEWFVGGASGAQTTAVKGAWPEILPAGVTVADSRFVLDLDDATSLAFTPFAEDAPEANVLTRMTMVAKFTPNALTMPEIEDGVKTALTVSNDTYYAYANGVWVELVGPEPSADAVTVLVEADYKYDVPRARFGIVAGTSVDYLHALDAEPGSWLSLGGKTPDPALVGQVSFGGEGELTSLRGDVQLGLFANGGVKYGTADEAVAAAQASGGSSTVTVLRDNSETITIPAGSVIALDTNGKSCGTVDNQSGKAVQVDVPAADVAKGNGLVEIKTTVSGDYTVVTTDDSKEIAETRVEDGKTYALVTTKASIIESLKVADKTLTVKPALREFLQTNSSVYSGPGSTTAGIQAQLDATGGNGLTVGQSYALGLATDKAIVLQPAAADTSTSAVTLAIPGVNPNDDFTVTYQTQSTTDGESWSNVGTPTATPQIPVGSGRFRVNTVIEPK